MGTIFIRRKKMDHEQKCMACGQEGPVVWSGSYRFCRLCTNNKALAIEVANARHKEKLEAILKDPEPSLKD
jgi:hypothetical protein